MTGSENLPQVRRIIYLKDLLRELVARDMKLRYKRSLLGVLWSLVNPLAQLMIFVFLFRSVLPLDISNYPTFVFSGLLSWIWFQSSLIMATGAITDNRELIRQPGFPAAVLPAAVVTTQMIHFLLAVPVLILLQALGHGPLGTTLLALPGVIALQFLWTLSLAYLLASCHVFFRDTQHLIGVLTLLLFYLTPVFYDIGAVPPRYLWLYRLNPMVHLIEFYRAILIRGELPEGSSVVAVGAVAVFLLGCGYQIFVHVKYRFVEEL